MFGALAGAAISAIPAIGGLFKKKDNTYKAQHGKESQNIRYYSMLADLLNRGNPIGEMMLQSDPREAQRALKFAGYSHRDEVDKTRPGQYNNPYGQAAVNTLNDLRRSNTGMFR